MIPAHAANFARLTLDEAVMLTEHLVRSQLIPEPTTPTQIDGITVATMCQDLSHAEVILSIADTTSSTFVSIMSKLLARPLYMCARGETGEPPVDILGRPLQTPIGHRLGQPAPEPALPRSVTRHLPPPPPRITTLRDPRVIATVAPNPKRPDSKSFPRYALYRPGMTVSEYVQLGGRREDIKYDVGKGYITLKLGT